MSTPIHIDLAEHGPHRLVALTGSASTPCDCGHGAAPAAVLAVDLAVAYECGTTKDVAAARLAVAGGFLAEDDDFWAAVRPFIERAWARAEAA